MSKKIYTKTELEWTVSSWQRDASSDGTDVYMEGPDYYDNFQVSLEVAESVHRRLGEAIAAIKEANNE